MDVQDLVTGVRWELLQHIARAPATGAELARMLSTTAANVSQHLKLLELGGLVSKERVNGKAMHYRLAQRMALVTLLDAPATRSIVALNQVTAAQMRLLTEGGPTSRALRLFLCQHEDLAQTFTAFGQIASSAQEVQLLVIAEDVKALRKEHANVHIGDVKIVIWSHTAAEFVDGLERSDSYFTEKLKTVKSLADQDGLFAHWHATYFPTTAYHKPTDSSHHTPSARAHRGGSE